MAVGVVAEQACACHWMWRSVRKLLEMKKPTIN